MSGENRDEQMVTYLGEAQEHMNEHGNVEAAKDQVCLPFNVDKGRWHEVGQREVEDPVGRGRESDGFTTNSQREEFGRIDPGNLPRSGQSRLHATGEILTGPQVGAKDATKR